MTETYFTRRKPLALVLDVEVSEPCELTVRGYDPERADTVYFDRALGAKTPVQGRQNLVFPLPLSPERLRVRLTPSAGRVTVHRQLSAPLATSPVALTDMDEQYIAFARWIATNLAELPPTRPGQPPYQWNGSEFVMQLAPVIRHRDTGAAEATPARVSHRQPVVEVSKSKMLGYTIPMRLVVLLHEYMHYKYNSFNESECDLRALEIFVALGYAPTEGLAALTKVLTDAPEPLMRAAAALHYLMQLDAENRPYAAFLN